MAFQRDGSNNVIAFAEAEDVRNLDQRLFEANEISFANSGTAATTLEEYLDNGQHTHCFQESFSEKIMWLRTGKLI